VPGVPGVPRVPGVPGVPRVPGCPKVIEALLEGKIGGPWQILGWTWPTIHGPYAVAYDLAFDGVKTRMFELASITASGNRPMGRASCVAEFRRARSLRSREALRRPETPAARTACARQD
jgi:hypothetical protein